MIGFCERCQKVCHEVVCDLHHLGEVPQQALLIQSFSKPWALAGASHLHPGAVRLKYVQFARGLARGLAGLSVFVRLLGSSWGCPGLPNPASPEQYRRRLPEAICLTVTRDLGDFPDVDRSAESCDIHLVEEVAEGGIGGRTPEFDAQRPPNTMWCWWHRRSLLLQE